MTLLHRVALPFLVLGLLSQMGNGSVTSQGPLEPATGPQVARSVLSDTLLTSAESGTPLILTLPSELNGRSVEHYTLLRGPALSGVAGRSFTWIPQGSDLGMHKALLQAHAPDASTDTLVLRIDLQS